jgi:hypothetical protein
MSILNKEEEIINSDMAETLLPANGTIDLQLIRSHRTKYVIQISIDNVL